jgi:hypothetical protein
MVMQRAQEYKSYINLEQGTKPSTYVSSIALESNASLIRKTNCVDIALGLNDSMINHNIDLMKQKELSGRMDFLDKNPEVTLPVNLDSVLTDNEQPESSNASQVVNAPLKDKSKVESSWAQVVANGLETSNNSNNSNERCNLEH